MDESFATYFMKNNKTLLEGVTEFNYNSTKEGTYNLSITSNFNPKTATSSFELIYTANLNGVGGVYRKIILYLDEGRSVITYSSSVEQEDVKEEDGMVMGFKKLSTLDRSFLDFLIYNSLEAFGCKGKSNVNVSDKELLKKSLKPSLVNKSYLEAYFTLFKRFNEYDMDKGLKVLESDNNKPFLDALERVLKVYEPKDDVFQGIKLWEYAECVVSNLFHAQSKNEYHDMIMTLIRDFKIRKSINSLPVK
ncbi:MAG: hypothetical protein JW791_01400 [Nanoarchaeota archaeon]|nr:hypothetical protein [Nanoarchaeota archaeon]